MAIKIIPDQTLQNLGQRIWIHFKLEIIQDFGEFCWKVVLFETVYAYVWRTYPTIYIK